MDLGKAGTKARHPGRRKISPAEGLLILHRPARTGCRLIRSSHGPGSRKAHAINGSGARDMAASEGRSSRAIALRAGENARVDPLARTTRKPPQRQVHAGGQSLIGHARTARIMASPRARHVAGPRDVAFGSQVHHLSRRDSRADPTAKPIRPAAGRARRICRSRATKRRPPVFASWHSDALEVSVGSRHRMPGPAAGSPWSRRAALSCRKSGSRSSPA